MGRRVTARPIGATREVGTAAEEAIKSTHTAGDFGFDPLGLKPKEPKELMEMQTKELNNGRLAMIAIAGMVVQEAVTGQKLF